MIEIINLVLLLLVLSDLVYLTIRMRSRSSCRSRRQPIFVDTSVLMDGRILDIAQTGFITDDLIVPRSVVRELQLLADGRDNDKRERARYGLDIVNALERVVHFNLTILPDELDRTPVDERLLELAKSEPGKILTLDYNLMKVAATEKIPTLNINDLAMSLSQKHLPGEKLQLKIISAGSNENQGVGYTDDGVMVVVDRAKDKIGKTIAVELVRFSQTSAGRMIFAKATASANAESKNTQSIAKASSRSALKQNKHHRNRRESH